MPLERHHGALERENWRPGCDRCSRCLSEMIGGAGGGPASAHVPPRAGPSLPPGTAPPCLCSGSCLCHSSLGAASSLAEGRGLDPGRGFRGQVPGADPCWGWTTGRRDRESEAGGTPLHPQLWIAWCLSSAAGGAASRSVRRGQGDTGPGYGGGGSLSLQGVDQAGLASAMVGGLPSPMPAPEMTLARNRLPCHGPG